MLAKSDANVSQRRYEAKLNLDLGKGRLEPCHAERNLWRHWICNVFFSEVSLGGNILRSGNEAKNKKNILILHKKQK